MEFNEQKAIEIIEKYGLSETTLRIWKLRNSIPDKYTKDDYKPREIVDNDYLTNYKRLLETLKNEAVNTNTIARAADVSTNKINDALRNKVKLSNADFIKMKSEINALKIFVAKCIAQRDYKALLCDARIDARPVLSRFANNNEYQKIIRFKNGNISYLDETEQKLKDAYSIFAMSLRI